MGMIKSFVHRGLEQFFLTGSKAGIQPRHAVRLRLILVQLNQARTVDDMNIPTLRLHESERQPQRNLVCDCTSQLARYLSLCGWRC